ncbi:YfhO family protein [Flavobacterium sp. '19STA2R22 D10 B1']|uniref:YfhO family protein n=1 Tax=Flavobacterium aerium TaxID=3037261 RepID=UPI00278C106D|nr:YfhO family protein [Flavobacterium sp. '19STA2R22 D10 B1']
MKVINRFYPHALAVLGFILISLIYFYPVLQGKKIFQSDIAQYTGMAKEQNDFRKSEDLEPYWTNSAFGGMPTYQLGAHYPHDYVKKIDGMIRFLPRPADYLFVYFLGFYALLLVLKIDPLKAFIGALAFGFSTYLIIILGVGHNAKAHAIAYMPLVIAGVLLVFQKHYIKGGLLTMFAVALEINANHFQMTFYLLILLLILSAYFAVKLIKEKDYRALLTSIGVFVVAGILALGANATNLLATSEYAKFSTRDKSELTFNPDGTPMTSSSAMTYEYITEYSYGIAESFNLIAPKLFGGSNHESLDANSSMYNFISSQGVPPAQASEIIKTMPTYWGDQPIVAAPAYIGAIVFFLFILALFAEKRKLKYAFLAGAIVSLLLSWGKNFPLLTDLFIDYFPMYNRFRAVSSIQVLLELCIPVLAIMGLYSFFKLDKEAQWKALWKSGAVSLGVVAFLFIIKGFFNFSGGNDAFYSENYGPEFVRALKEDRASMYTSDLLRTGFLILLSAGVLWFFVKDKLSQTVTIIIVGVLMVSDLVLIDKNYVDSKSFVSAFEVDRPFKATPTDLEILKDTTHYRVFEVQGNMSSARASYFHHSLGGYSAVKPRRIQQLFDYQIAKNNRQVLDMLNVKYVIQTGEKGEEFPATNPGVNGNAWFVEQIVWANSADDEMKALDKINTKKTAVINKTDFGSVIKNETFTKDSLATITLEKYKPNYLKYNSTNTHDGLAVFSEIYYKNGWNAFIDGKEVPHVNADYVLRALEIPAGKHVIEFKFEPKVIKTGSTIALISTIGMILLLIVGAYFERKRCGSCSKEKTV